MTRPKVDPDKRQRIAQACDSCKRRKQKCNGAKPCSNCAKRGLQCSFGDEPALEDSQPSPKRWKGLAVSIPAEDPGLGLPISPAVSQPSVSTNNRRYDSLLSSRLQVTGGTMHALNNLPDDLPDSNGIKDVGSPSRGSSKHEEEAVVYTNTRMLQDPTGRLLYFGDSCSLSFLQLIRMIVESVAGPSRFTQDPLRHRIVEGTASLPSHIRRTHLLPDRETAATLVESYFTNINGLVEVCQRKSFMQTLDQCYLDPLGTEPQWLCLLHLVFAIGLIMASPQPGTPEDAIIRRLRAEPFDRAELFYENAKELRDPSTGFEDSGFWSIQALTLMSLYMLAVSRRNAAYAYHGMAVRSAFALGLHREETMYIFGSAEQAVRRNLWRTLFVLDRFLATSLGRPTAIRESDCSGTTLFTGEEAPFPQAPFPTAANADYMSSSMLGLEASVRSCHVLGIILEKVYSERKISTKLAQEIADSCKGWPKALDPSLHHRKAAAASREQGIAILHVNLLYCHSIILLTRPFYLFLMNKAYQGPKTSGPGSVQQSHGSRMEKFAAACVIASTQSIALVQSAHEHLQLSQRNPFVLYFLFAASLVVLANEFCGLYHNPNSGPSLNNAINVMHYFCDQDPQARRLVVILETFREVVIQQQSVRSQQPGATQHPDGTIRTAPLSLAGDINDAMSNLFYGSTPFSVSNDPYAISGPDPTGTHSTSLRFPTPLQPASAFSPPNEDFRNTPRDTSFDPFFDLARVSSHPNSQANSTGNDCFGEGEFDFDSLWQLATQGPPLPPNTMSSLNPNAMAPSGQLGGNGEFRRVGDHVPLYEASNREFDRH